MGAGGGGGRRGAVGPRGEFGALRGVGLRGGFGGRMCRRWNAEGGGGWETKWPRWGSALRRRPARAGAAPPKAPRQDDPRARRIARRMPSAAEVAATSRAAVAEAARQRRALAPAIARVTGESWVSLGPVDAFQEFNDVSVGSVDSGRASGIAVDPRDGNVVYLATSGGGVWKTYDYLLGAPNPTWLPLTDQLPSLAIGALALDAANPDTLLIGTGDAFDTPGNTVQRSDDGGATWSTPVALAGTYPAPNGFVAEVRSVRDLRVAGDVALVATDVGLFRSTDGGTSFGLIDLPNGPNHLAES